MELKRSVCNPNVIDRHVDDVEASLMEDIRRYCPPGSYIERELIEGDERFGGQHYRLILVSPMTWKEVFKLIGTDDDKADLSSVREVAVSIDQGGPKMPEEPKVVNSETIKGNCGADVVRMIWDNGKITYVCTEGEGRQFCNKCCDCHGHHH